MYLYVKRLPMSDRKPPMQPVEWNGHGVVRFRKNAIVRHLVDNGTIDLNRLRASAPPFSQEDWSQLAQLIGYSVSAWGGLSYVSPLDCAAADYEVKCLVKEIPEDPGK